MTKHLSEEKRRRQIIRAARRLWVRSGFAASSMNQVAAEAGLSKGGVYFHFASKDDLLHACIDEFFGELMDAMETVIPDLPAGVDGLMALARRYIRWLMRDREAARFYLVMHEVALRDTRVRRKILDHHYRPIQIAITYALEGRRIPPVERRAERWEKRKNKPEVTLVVAMLDGMTRTVALGRSIDIAPAERSLRRMLVGLADSQVANEKEFT